MRLTWRAFECSEPLSCFYFPSFDGEFSFNGDVWCWQVFWLENFPGSFFHSDSLHSFCRTSLPLASTGWAQSTFSSRCSLSSKQHHCLTSATPTMFPKKYGVLGIEPRAAGYESKYANHWAILSPSLYSFPSFLGFHFDFDGDHKKATASPFTPSSLMRLTAEKWWH